MGDSSMSNGFKNLLNRFFSVNPKEVNGTGNIAFYFWQNQLWLKLYSVFKFNNIPDSIDLDFMREVLLSEGVVCFFKPQYAMEPVALNCSPTGQNLYYMPTRCVIANPVLGNWSGVIGKDCEIVFLNHLRGNFYNFTQLVDRYSALLANVDGSINTTLINSRVAQVFQAGDNATLKTMQKVYDDVTAGKPAVFINKGMKTEAESLPFFNNVKQTYIGTELLDTHRTIMNQFLTEIGIDNTNTDKKERLITEEANANKQEVKSIAELVVENMNECFDKVNAMFNTSITVELRKGVVVNANGRDIERLNEIV